MKKFTYYLQDLTDKVFPGKKSSQRATLKAALVALVMTPVLASAGVGAELPKPLPPVKYKVTMRKPNSFLAMISLNGHFFLVDVEDGDTSGWVEVDPSQYDNFPYYSYNTEDNTYTFIRAIYGQNTPAPGTTPCAPCHPPEAPLEP